ncbi:MAG: DUF4398 domain-containing protein [Oligoflexia bacterium]|nr:DUF4398 domain-containing protein [Oligoflexia bacterium]
MKRVLGQRIEEETSSLLKSKKNNGIKKFIAFIMFTIETVRLLIFNKNKRRAVFFTFLMSLLSLALLISLTGGCAFTMAKPKLELSMAQAAFMAAKQAKANTLAPNLYRKAEVYFMKAKSAYKRKYFAKAKQYAILSKQFSERAEFVSIRQSTMN